MSTDIRPNRATDPVSEALRAWFLPGWWAGLAAFEGPWGIAVPEGLGSFYLMLAGRCCLTFADGSQPEEIEAGDVLLLSEGAAYRLQHAPESPTVSYPDGFRKNGAGGPRPQPLAGSARLVFGHFSIASLGAGTPAVGFGRMVRLKADSCPLLSRHPAILEAVLEEQSTQTPGWQAIVDHLVQTLLLQTLRAVILQDGAEREARSEGGRSLFQAALDGAIGPALQLIHRRPEEPWTVTALASHVNISKSAFSERFHQLVGKPPLRYLTEHRMQKASRLLLDTEFGVKEIASLVGYESASSFSNAFKRCTGQAPVDFRKNGHASSKETSPEGI